MNSAVFRWEATLSDQGAPQFDAVLQIDAECHDGRTADRSATDERCIGPAEMTRPFVPTRVEKANDFPGLRVTAGEIRSFPQVAGVTRQCEVGADRSATMLPRNNVVDVKGKFVRRLRDETVFARFSGTPPDEPFERAVHQRVSAAALRFSDDRAFDFNVERKWPIRSYFSAWALSPRVKVPASAFSLRSCIRRRSSSENSHFRIVRATEGGRAGLSASMILLKMAASDVAIMQGTL
jgi:hypothetical protein